MESETPGVHEPREAPFLHAKAQRDIRFIRETMERAGSFTAVPGWGGTAMGAIALLATAVSWNASPATWLAIWLGAAFAASTVGTAAMLRKARRSGMTLLGGPGRRFALAFAPSLGVGAILTFALWRAGQAALLPGVWLLVYGAAVVAGGAHSISVVPVLGGLLMLLGVAALIGPPAWGAAFLGTGFGVLHIVFGALIGRKHGG